MTPLEIVRRRKLLTQRELAKRAGVGHSTVYLIENGKVRPRLSIIRKLAAALEVDPADVNEFRAAIGVEPERRRVAA